MGRIYNKPASWASEYKKHGETHHQWKREQFGRRKCSLCGATKKSKGKRPEVEFGRLVVR